MADEYNQAVAEWLAEAGPAFDRLRSALAGLIRERQRETDPRKQVELDFRIGAGLQTVREFGAALVAIRNGEDPPEPVEPRGWIS